MNPPTVKWCSGVILAIVLALGARLLLADDVNAGRALSRAELANTRGAAVGAGCGCGGQTTNYQACMGYSTAVPCVEGDAVCEQNFKIYTGAEQTTCDAPLPGSTAVCNAGNKVECVTWSRGVSTVPSHSFSYCTAFGCMSQWPLPGTCTNCSKGSDLPWMTTWVTNYTCN